MKKIIGLGLTLVFASVSTIFASTDEIVEKQNTILKKLDSIRVKEGIEFNGKFKGEVIRTNIEGNAANETMRQSEEVTYTRVDFDVKARPNTSTTARAIFRMQADWPIYWGSLYNPIVTRWISLDGHIGQYFYYHVGDFKAKWSPFTISNWYTEILNEPDIFSELRKESMDEVFSSPGEEYRPFQGFNVKFAAKSGVFDYLGLELLGARLRAALIPKIQSGQPISTGANLYATSFEAAEYDRIAYGLKGDFSLFNVDVTPMFLQIKDLKLSTKYYTTPPLTATNMGANLAVNVGKFINMNNLELKLFAEVNASSFKNDTAEVDTNYTKEVDNVTGNAFRAGLDVGYGLEVADIKLNVEFSNTSEKFRADLSQSPSYVPRRILNIDNDSLNGGGLKHFSIFDSRYYSVWKSMTKNYTERGIEYTPYPSTKNAYTNVIIAAEETKIFEKYPTIEDARFDILTADAYGPATPNLNMLKANLGVGVLDNAIKLDVEFNNSQNNKELQFTSYDTTIVQDTIQATIDTNITVNNVVINKTKFNYIGLGLTLNINKFLNTKRMIQLKGSYIMSNAKRDKSAGISDEMDNVMLTALDTKTSLMNVGLYVNVINKLSLMGGLQIYNVKDESYSNMKVDYQDMNWMAGIEYKLNSGAYLISEYGVISHKDNNDENLNFDMPVFRTTINVNF